MKTNFWISPLLLAAFILLVPATPILWGQQQAAWQKIPFDSSAAGVTNIMRLYTAPDSTIYAMTTDKTFGVLQYLTVPQAQRLYFLNSTGTSWLQIPFPSFVKTITSVQQSTAGTLYVATYSQDLATSGFPVLLRSTNKGVTWTASVIDNTTASAEIFCSEKGLLYASIDPIVKQSGRINSFVPVIAKVLRSKDDGATWESLLQISTSGSIYGLTVSKDRRILLATEDPPCSPIDAKAVDGGDILQSQDAGKTWSVSTVSKLRWGFCQTQFIYSFAVNNSTNQVIASVEGTTFSLSDGIEWTPVVNNITSQSTAIQYSSNSIFLFSGRSIKRYSADFSTFATILFSGVETPFFPATLAFGKNNRLYMGGFNTGSAYSLDLSTLQPTSASNEQTISDIGVNIAPNPTTNAANIVLTLPTASPVRLTLHDALGREVRIVAEGMYAAGAQEFSVSLDGLPSGIYFVRANVGGQVLVRRLAVVR